MPQIFSRCRARCWRQICRRHQSCRQRLSCRNLRLALQQRRQLSGSMALVQGGQQTTECSSWRAADSVQQRSVGPPTQAQPVALLMLYSEHRRSSPNSHGR